MSENTCTEPCLAVKADAYEDNKKRIVNIYVSAESLKVFENPWVEDAPAAFGGQQPGMLGDTHHSGVFHWDSGIFQSVIHVVMGLIFRFLIGWFVIPFGNVL